MFNIVLDDNLNELFINKLKKINKELKLIIEQNKEDITNLMNKENKMINQKELSEINAILEGKEIKYNKEYAEKKNAYRDMYIFKYHQSSKESNVNDVIEKIIKYYSKQNAIPDDICNELQENVNRAIECYIPYYEMYVERLNQYYNKLCLSIIKLTRCASKTYM